MTHVLKPIAAAAIFLLAAQCVPAATWNLDVGGTWNATASWSPTTIPNAIGASAIFNGAATANNPDQTANRTITLDAKQIVGSLVFNTDLGSFTNTITTGSGSAPNLIFNNGGSGATITTMGSGTGNNTLGGAIRLDENVTANVNNTAATSANGSLVSTTGISGVGGFTKAGDGLATFSTAGKSYTGPTNISGGRLRMSPSGITSGTSSFTINGGQLDLIIAGTFTLGTGPLILSGAGPTTGPFAAFPGVIRPDTNLAILIANASVVLQSDSTLHSQGSASGSITLSGNVSGNGGLIAGAVLHDANIGQIILSGANGYKGGTTVNDGTLAATGSSTTAFGTGNVTVVSANAAFGGSSAKIAIQGGATNAIADSATLSLAGGNAAGFADDGYIDLAAGINETVGGLILGGVTQTAFGTTYGATGSGATNINDEYFAGTGVITLATPASVSGDYNNNGIVDAADYVLWRKGGTLANDPTPGNQPADYDFWRARFGKSAGSGSGTGLSTSPVPEPAAISLIFFAIPILLFGRSRHCNCFTILTHI